MILRSLCGTSLRQRYHSRSLQPLRQEFPQPRPLEYRVDLLAHQDFHMRRLRRHVADAQRRTEGLAETRRIDHSAQLGELGEAGCLSRMEVAMHIVFENQYAELLRDVSGEVFARKKILQRAHPVVTTNGQSTMVTLMGAVALLLCCIPRRTPSP